MLAPQDLKKLATVHGPCLTILQPLRDEFSQVTKADTRVTAAAQHADELLAEAGFVASERERFLRPIHKIAANTNWSGRTGSIAIFRAPGFTKASFWPDNLPGRVSVGEEFFVLPLMTGFAARRDYWVLALSINRIRLFHGSQEAFTEVSLPDGFPVNLQDATGLDKPDHDLENRSSAGPSMGHMKAVHFGTSSAYETKGPHLRDFFHSIDRALQPILGRNGDPLILAAIPRELALYREVNTYTPVLEQGIHGNADSLGEVRLRRTALELLAACPEHTQQAIQREMEKASDRGLLASDPEAIRVAAEQGQVATLYVDVQPRIHEAEINAATLAVIRHAGEVVAAESVPGDGMAAVLRYALGSPKTELAQLSA